jgi:pyruvate formate lyase activating enzyme
VEACPINAIDPDIAGAIRRESCDVCGRCVDVCPVDALKFVGRAYQPDELVELLLRDVTYYDASGGGVTFSGGECTMHPEFLEQILTRLKRRNVHIAIQTSGCFDYGSVSSTILPYVDLIYYDIKFADPQKHRKYTGRSNHRIIDNFRRLVRARSDSVHARIPLVPGITATRENLQEVAELLVKSGARQASLLPYNPMGISKQEGLGLPTPSLPNGFMDPNDEAEICAMFGEMVDGFKSRIAPVGQFSEEAPSA